mmetsp:Transcript_13142/g.22530  ORF Transcript_13142/g.22530 Transcript_13142/m.22530 type:complete len:123 (+) Transcript_13142:76-444(+)
MDPSMTQVPSASEQPSAPVVPIEISSGKVPIFRGPAREKIRKQWQTEALCWCDPEVKAFYDCAKANSWKVVFLCRQENNIMNACLKERTTAERHYELKIEHAKNNPQDIIGWEDYDVEKLRR